MNPMIHFIKQLSGKIGPNLYTSVLSQRDAGQVAYIRQLQRELKKENVLEVPLSQLKVVVFDIETTGFYPNKGDRVLSIGAIKVIGDKVLEGETFYTLIQSDQGPSKEIEELTGIKAIDLKEAPLIESVLIQFFQFIKGSTLVAHHANHERNFMQHVTWSVLKTRFEQRIVDTKFLTQIVVPEINLITLDECCIHFGIEIKQRHHALHDAHATAELWAANIRAITKLGYENLKDVYTHIASLR
ncbi:DNA polymerase-3 subunit epsilon [Evansella vedderi]|uniref:DNA polymerase-3 subunit epsilon n=1 Tax=Evansella vedderi TaxID=38282 RepID=A0ABT9ZV33_9BACI|nr:exonuclease domain-containing protein [Evansella vedderi]MDQ0255103.1 DNA polymerase-3 subunit epsilon [Evansella vedderi]